MGTSVVPLMPERVGTDFIKLETLTFQKLIKDLRKSAIYQCNPEMRGEEGSVFIANSGGSPGCEAVSQWLIERPWLIPAQQFAKSGLRRDCPGLCL